MVLPLIFLFLCIALSLVLSFVRYLRQKRLLFCILLGVSLALGIASMVFAFFFVDKAFPTINPVAGKFAVIGLYGAILCLLAFILFKEKKAPIPQLILVAFLLFGVLFLALAFTYGRTNLDNETVVEKSTSALRILRYYLPF